jgi:preprotein translocase subunit SecE
LRSRSRAPSASGATTRRTSRSGTHHEPHRRFRFVHESWAELKKVEWPGQNQVIQGTVVVLIACAIVGLYLWVNDEIWKQVVQKVFLR